MICGSTATILTGSGEPLVLVTSSSLATTPSAHNIICISDALMHNCVHDSAPGVMRSKWTTHRSLIVPTVHGGPNCILWLCRLERSIRSRHRPTPRKHNPRVHTPGSCAARVTVLDWVAGRLLNKWGGCHWSILHWSQIIELLIVRSHG